MSKAVSAHSDHNLCVSWPKIWSCLLQKEILYFWYQRSLRSDFSQKGETALSVYTDFVSHELFCTVKGLWHNYNAAQLVWIFFTIISSVLQGNGKKNCTGFAPVLLPSQITYGYYLLNLIQGAY